VFLLNEGLEIRGRVSFWCSCSMNGGVARAMREKGGVGAVAGRKENNNKK
jgi:hypothetical protein